MAKSPDKFPEIVRYGAGMVRIHRRSNGLFALSWREGGRTKRTTRSKIEDARHFAAVTAKALDRASGQRLLPPAAAERAREFERIAGSPEAAARLLPDIEAALRALGGNATLSEAAEYFASHHPASVHAALSLAEAVEKFLAEYKNQPSTTVRSLKQPLRALVARHPDARLIDLSREMIEAYARHNASSPRTIRNRIAAWRTFVHRATELGWWPAARPNPAALIKQPRLPDKAPAIFSPQEGAALLRLITRQQPQHLSFLLVAGWLGCRPSECQRLTWEDFDWENALLHIRAEVALKTHRERWIPIRPGLLHRLRQLSETYPGDRACRWRAREFISSAARKSGIVSTWPADGLRHSFITYRLREIENIDRVAEEAGNSPAEIRASYRRPIPPGVAEAWWQLVM